MITIYHNNRCGKSRDALHILEEKNLEFTVIDYLKNPPTAKELELILKKLGLKAQDIIRTKESIYKDLYKGKSLSEKEWIQVLIEHPILIERPIVINGEKAIVARPPEKVCEIL